MLKAKAVRGRKKKIPNIFEVDLNPIMKKKLKARRLGGDENDPHIVRQNREDEVMEGNDEGGDEENKRRIRTIKSG